MQALNRTAHPSPQKQEHRGHVEGGTHKRRHTPKDTTKAAKKLINNPEADALPTVRQTGQCVFEE
jgi:hypothetical protein